MIAAFFDMDETLIGVNSARLWIEHMWRTGELRTRDLLKSLVWLVGYRLALVDVRRVAQDAALLLEGASEEETAQRVEDWYAEAVRPHVIPEMVEIVEDHRRRGHRLVLLTASSPYVARPLVRDVGLDDLLCTRFEVVEGVFTGRIEVPMCYGSGKVELSERWARRHGVDLDASWFYTDSYTDRPMLERVGRPVAINPDPRLSRWARSRGIETRSF